MEENTLQASPQSLIDTNSTDTEKSSERLSILEQEFCTVLASVPARCVTVLIVKLGTEDRNSISSHLRSAGLDEQSTRRLFLKRDSTRAI